MKIFDTVPPLHGLTCVHVSSEYVDGRVVHTQCHYLADREGKQGWLCTAHADIMDEMIRATFPVIPVYRDRDQELVESILQGDARAIAADPTLKRWWLRSTVMDATITRVGV